MEVQSQAIHSPANPAQESTIGIDSAMRERSGSFRGTISHAAGQSLWFVFSSGISSQMAGRRVSPAFHLSFNLKGRTNGKKQTKRISNSDTRERQL